MSIKYTYKGNLTDTESSHIKLNTAGKYLEGDVEIEAEGGGGATATVVVTAPTGSTVTMTKDAVTKTATEVSGTWTFYFTFEEVGVWTITATKDSLYSSDQIDIDEATTYYAEISFMPSGCIAEYLFNGNTNDTSGEGNNLTNSGITFADSGLTGIPKCGVFNGSAKGVASAGVFPVGASSVSFWIKTSMTSYSTPLDTTTSDGQGVCVFKLPDGHIRWRIRGASNVSDADSISLVNDGLWHHVVVTATNDTSANGLKVYIDGSLETQTTISSAYTSHKANLSVGSLANRSEFMLIGNLAAMRIYNRVLSASEVSTLYNGGQGK